MDGTNTIPRLLDQPALDAIADPLSRAVKGAYASAGDAGQLTAYAPEAVEKISGVPAKRLERIARSIGERKPAVAIAGGPTLAYSNASFHALAVNALNSILGSVGEPGGVFFTPGFEPLRTLRPSHELTNLASAQAVLLDGANPVYGSPKAS